MSNQVVLLCSHVLKIYLVCNSIVGMRLNLIASFSNLTSCCSQVFLMQAFDCKHLKGKWLFVVRGKGGQNAKALFWYFANLREYCLISCDYWINLDIVNTIAKSKNAACIHRSRPTLGESFLQVSVVTLLLKSRN